MNEKESLFELLKSLIKKSQVLHSDNFSLTNDLIYSKIINDFVDINSVGFLDLAQLFLNTNTKDGLINALNISLKTVGCDTKMQEKLIIECLENIEKSNDFKTSDKYLVFNLAQTKFPHLFK